MRKTFILGIFALSWGLPSFADVSHEQAMRVGSLIGIGQNGACSSCHALNSSRTVSRWQTAYRSVKACLDGNQYPAAIDRINCIAGRDSSQALVLPPSKLGFYATALQLPEFQNLLADAYGAEKAAQITDDLRESTMMPLHGKNLSPDEFLELSQWLDDGMPFLNQMLNPVPAPGTCEETVSPAFREHIIRSERDGWQSRNREAGLRMFGCNEGSCFGQQRDGKAIFPEVAGVPDAKSWKVDASTHMHILNEMRDETQYWVRSSTDGRFVAYGGSPSGVIDLQSSLLSAEPARVISVDAYYDPGFFPDDSAFMFQGHGTGICQMRLLKDARTKSINFDEDACSSDDDTEIPLYQSIGASLDGSDYLAATGYFESDSGNGSIFAREAGLRGISDSRLYLHPLLFDGQRWVRRDPQVFETPWEIDWSMAPSNRLLIGRRQGYVGDSMQHLGYNIYELKRASATDAYEKTSLAQICLDGLKGNFSFEDRFFVTYAYIKAEHYKLLGFKSVDDPEFQKLLKAGGSNLFLYDFLTQKTTTITHMGENQFALFPHFRSDGWIYFMVYDANKGRRLIMATDTAVLAKAAVPTAP